MLTQIGMLFMTGVVEEIKSIARSNVGAIQRPVASEVHLKSQHGIRTMPISTTQVSCELNGHQVERDRHVQHQWLVAIPMFHTKPREERHSQTTLHNEP